MFVLDILYNDFLEFYGYWNTIEYLSNLEILIEKLISEKKVLRLASRLAMEEPRLTPKVNREHMIWTA